MIKSISQTNKIVSPKPLLVLGLVASPRASGNCELFTKEISEHISAPHTLRLIRLTSLRIEPCKGCYHCIMGTSCPQKDDLEFLLEEIVRADAVIISSPVYFLGANGIIKRFLDRGFLFYRTIHETYGKPCILLNFFGIKDRLGVAPQTLQSFAVFFGLAVKGNVNIHAALPGEALMSKKNVRLAQQLAGKLFSPGEIKKKRGCPYCGCEIVRMAKKDFICTLCHSTFAIDGSGNSIKIKDGGMLGPPKHMLLHKAWLQKMKNRFLRHRREIARLSAQYKDIGEWITPR